jgi:single stranded DNA-binding protein
VNKVLLAGRLTRDPEMRALASGKHVTQFSVATTEYAGNGKERPEYHNIVTWDQRPLSTTVGPCTVGAQCLDARGRGSRRR